MVRVGPFKLIRGDPGRPDGWIRPDMVVNVDEVQPPMGYDQEELQRSRNSEHVLLFHLVEDPHEKTNLATKYPAITQYLVRLLDQYQVTFSDACFCPPRPGWWHRTLRPGWMRETPSILEESGAQDGVTLPQQFLDKFLNSRLSCY